MLRPRSSLGLLLTHGGEVPAARLVPNQIEDELHFGRPRFVVNEEYLALCFKMVSSVKGKGFVPSLIEYVR